jgi:hypothetical protein
MLAPLEPDRAARVASMLAAGARWGESERTRVQDIHMAGRAEGGRTPGTDLSSGHEDFQSPIRRA